MKKMYKAEIKVDYLADWDADAIQDYIDAENEEEAIEIAKEYLKESCIENGCDPEEIEGWEIRVIEV